MTNLPPIKGIIETSFIDWHGVISTILFLPNCNLACPFCHNYTLVNNPNLYVTIEIKKILSRLQMFTGWIDGIVISGGEPTLYFRIDELFFLFKQAGFQTKLDTNGLRPKIIKDLCKRGLVDLISMDFKSSLTPLFYAHVTGKPVKLTTIVESINFLIYDGIYHEIRSTIWPSLHNIQELQNMSKSLIGAKAWTLQNMNPKHAWQFKSLNGNISYNQVDILELHQILVKPILASNDYFNKYCFL